MTDQNELVDILLTELVAARSEIRRLRLELLERINDEVADGTTESPR